MARVLGKKERLLCIEGVVPIFYLDTFFECFEAYSYCVVLFSITCHFIVMV